MGNKIGSLKAIRSSVVSNGTDSNVDWLIQVKPAKKKATKEATSRYFRCLEEVKQTVTGLVHIFNDAQICAADGKYDEYKLLLQSLQTRLIGLREDLTLLLKLSVYKVDLSVAERKDLGQEMFGMVEELRENVRREIETKHFDSYAHFETASLVRKLTNTRQNLAAVF